MRAKYVIFDDGRFQVRNIGGENVYYVKKGGRWVMLNDSTFSNAEGDHVKAIVGLSFPAILIGIVFGIAVFSMKG